MPRSYSPYLLFVTLFLCTAASAAPAPPAPDLPQEILPTDSRVRLDGRWDLTPVDGPRCAWSGCSIVVRLRGTALGVRFAQPGSVRWQVEVDGKPMGELPQVAADAVAVVQGLPDAEHVIRLVKRTEPFVGVARLIGLNLPAGAVLLPAPAPVHRLELIGDSITCGYGDEAKDQNQHFIADTENGAEAYGALAARRLGAAYECVAWSGKKLWPDNSILDLYDRILPDDARSQWDFSKEPADAVLINLGTDDFGGGNPDEEGWVNAYVQFLTRLRKDHPNALIYCAVGPMMSDAYSKSKNALTTCRRYIQRAIKERTDAGDSRVRFLEFPMQDGSTGFGADWHPSLATHQRMADQLVKALTQDLGWKEGPQ